MWVQAIYFVQHRNQENPNFSDMLQKLGHSFKTRLGHRLGRVLGHSVNGRTTESLVEPLD
ncbi:hypothetical protein MTR_0709s0020 [Medicago truncatula]|uniref:Uncharacterized protein n=1 Tax=Medicago truncatula TaxID=3880 RepID=A0A072TE10_MEDTR|nr:hypothetical protein MTR_0709s0020 [Medicago truncatula]